MLIIMQDGILKTTGDVYIKKENLKPMLNKYYIYDICIATPMAKFVISFQDEDDRNHIFNMLSTQLIENDNIDMYSLKNYDYEIKVI